MHVVQTFRSVVVDNFDVRRTLRGPSETDSILVVDSDAKLASPIAFKGFKTIRWWGLQIIQRVCNAKLIQLSVGDSPQAHRADCPSTSRSHTVEDIFGRLVRK
jgi:hypothetical protein